MNIPGNILLWVWQSLIGEIYPEVRAIALRFDNDKNLLLRYYLEREPTGDDYESVSQVITNIFAHTSSTNDLKSIQEEIIYTTKHLSEVDCLDGFVYARREYE